MKSKIITFVFVMEGSRRSILYSMDCSHQTFTTVPSVSETYAVAISNE